MVRVSSSEWAQMWDWWITHQFRKNQAEGYFPVYDNDQITWHFFHQGEWLKQGHKLPPDIILSSTQTSVSIPGDSGYVQAEIEWHD